MAMHDNNGNQDSLDNAEEIIERFGGIRPMATKMNVPVTTVQGWKKRNVIPGNRRSDVIQAARTNDIDVSDLIAGVANQNTARTPAPSYSEYAQPDYDFEPEVADSEHETDSDISESQGGFDREVREAAVHNNAAKEKQHQEAVMMAQKRVPNDRAATNEDLLRQMREAQSVTFNKSAWFTVGFVSFVIVIVAVVLWPSQEELHRNSAAIGELRSDIEELRGQEGTGTGVPGDLQDRLAVMQEQAQTIQGTVTRLSERVETMARDVMAPNASINERLARLEQHATSLGAPVQLTGMLHKIREMQASAGGQQQLSQAVASLNELVGRTSGQDGAVETALQQAQQQDDALGQTLQGVSANDLKAAALLLGLSQFRSSLNRNEPFAEDLALLQKLMGEQDPELQAAVSKLAPKAQQGVLTPEGLSNEFKGLAGDIVVSSLQGEDVSVQERAKARLNDILKVERDGQLITGTDTQATVARAQKMLEAGDVQGAIAELQTLEGEAAQTAQPFVDEAQFTLLAQQTQGMLTDKVIGSLSTAYPGANNVSVDQLIGEIKRMVGMPQPIRLPQ